MALIQTREPQQTLADDEHVRGEFSDGTLIIETDDGHGIVRPPEDTGVLEREYESWNDARLFAGLILKIDGYWTVHPESPVQNVPLKVAKHGKDAIAAYLRVGTGTTYSPEFVARKLDVSKQSVYNYATRIRWSAD